MNIFTTIPYRHPHPTYNIMLKTLNTNYYDTCPTSGGYRNILIFSFS